MTRKHGDEARIWRVGVNTCILITRWA